MTTLRERDLLIPALRCIEVGGEITTTQLIDCLRELLQPTGEDAEILATRRDDKFSQKVRNLVSHEALTRRHWATYERRGRNGYWKLTDAGRSVLDDNRELLDGVLRGRHAYPTQQTAFAEVERTRELRGPRRVLTFDEDETVAEGDVTPVAIKRRQRSGRLRALALQRLRKQFLLRCAACGFDFESVYGDRGRDYIEIHHEKPIFMYEDEDLEQRIADALGNLVPLCSNCHRMIHRRRDDIWTVDRLRKALS